MRATRSARLATSRSCASVLASWVPKITGSVMSPPRSRRRRLPLTSRRESRAVAARAAVRGRDFRAGCFAPLLVAMQRRDLLAHGLVALEAVGRSRQGTAVRDAVAGPGGQVDEVLHHTDMTPRPIRRAGRGGSPPGGPGASRR